MIGSFPAPGKGLAGGLDSKEELGTRRQRGAQGDTEGRRVLLRLARKLGTVLYRGFPRWNWKAASLSALAIN